MIDGPIDIELSHTNCMKIWWASCNTNLHGPFCGKGKTKKEALEDLKNTITNTGMKWPANPKVKVRK